MLPIVFGVLGVALSVILQAVTVTLVAHYAQRHRSRGRLGRSFIRDSGHLTVMMIILFLGHLAQIMMWAIPYRLADQFEDLKTAFYHSAVNYTTLGYGDLVMSPGWRTIGALEAATGVLMFGVSTAAFIGIMRSVFSLRMKESDAESSE